MKSLKTFGILSRSSHRAVLWGGTVAISVFALAWPDTGRAGINVWATHGPANQWVLALTVGPATPTTLYAGTRGAGAFKSTDAGDTWNAMNLGLTNHEVWALAVDPTRPAIVYAGTFGDGVFKSTDAGDNWEPINQGLTESAVWALRLAPATPRTLYAATGNGVFSFQQACVGDCNSDDSVTVTELVSLVNIATGNLDVSVCRLGDANADGQITVDEIMTALNNAWNGCG